MKVIKHATCQLRMWEIVGGSCSDMLKCSILQQAERISMLESEYECTWLHPEAFVESVTHFFPSSDWLVSLTVISISTQHVISMSGRQLHSLHCPQINLYLYWKHFRSTQRLFSVVLGLSRLRQFQGENPTSSVLWAKDRWGTHRHTHYYSGLHTLLSVQHACRLLNRSL